LSVAIGSVTKGEKPMTFPKDTFVVYMDQYNSPHAALTMEPAGARNFGNYWYSRAFSKKNGFFPVALNQDFPAYRFMGDASELKTYFSGSIMKMPFVTGTHIEWPFLPTQDEIKGFTKDVLSTGMNLVDFTGIIVNQHVGSLPPSNDATTGEPLFYDYNFKALLNKVPGAEEWYAWDWEEGEAVKIVADADGYAPLGEETIGPDYKVFLFAVAKSDILKLFKDGKLPDGAIFTEKGIKYIDMCEENTTILSDSMLDGWTIVGVDPKSGKCWKASIVNGELVIKFTGNVYDQVVTVTLKKIGSNETTTLEIDFSGEKENLLDWLREVAGCNAGFAMLALLALCPLVLRRK
jgi:Synergist-CTERM protein sorting domain-containing protein